MKFRDFESWKKGHVIVSWRDNNLLRSIFRVLNHVVKTGNKVTWKIAEDQSPLVWK